MRLVGGLAVEKYEDSVVSQRCVEHDGELFYVSQNLSRGPLKTRRETVECVEKFIKVNDTRKQRDEVLHRV